MNPTTPASQQQQVPFTEQHNTIYNGLRDMVAKYSAAGVPGMDQVANAIHKTHIGLMQNNYVPPKQPQTPAGPQKTPLNSLNDVMAKIRQQNSPSLPNGYQGYNA